MKISNWKVLWFPVVLLALTVSVVSADGVKGKVTDESGKPVRGALVRLTDASKKTLAVYSQKDGQYSLEVPAGNYDFAVEAFGFAVKRDKKDIAQQATVNFALTPKWDVSRLTGADIESLIPNDADGKLIKSTCIQCHDLAMPLRRRGQTAEEWKSFLPNMTSNRLGQPVWSDAKLTALSEALGKYYGPDSMFGADALPPPRDRVKHSDMPDAALSATITEWTIPTGANSFPHSISVDLKRGIAWFSEVGNTGFDPAKCAMFTPSTPNPAGGDCGDHKIGRFDIKSEKFTEFPAANPHTPAISADGRAWYSLTVRDNVQPSLAVVDPTTNKISYFKSNDRPHTPIVSRDGKIWLSGQPGIWSFDPETQQFKQYKFPVPDKAPDNALAKWQQVPGDAQSNPSGYTYHLAEDSAGKIWGASGEMGMLVRLDPNNGETKEFFPPNTTMIRGMAVDRDDNVWFAAYYDHKLGKLDPKTGTFKMYQPPSMGSAPYGVVADKKTGYIWYGDQSAYTMTRFDPKTEKFIEYRLPGNPAPPRFIDVDADGKVWFTDFWNGKIGYLDPNGASAQLASR